MFLFILFIRIKSYTLVKTFIQEAAWSGVIFWKIIFSLCLIFIYLLIDFFFFEVFNL